MMVGGVISQAAIHIIQQALKALRLEKGNSRASYGN
jgi:hypothetical protein